MVCISSTIPAKRRLASASKPRWGFPLTPIYVSFDLSLPAASHLLPSFHYAVNRDLWRSWPHLSSSYSKIFPTPLSASEFENFCIADFFTYLIDINKPTLPTNFLIWSCLHTKELLLVASVAYALFCEDTYDSSIAATRAILHVVSHCTSSALLSSAFRYRFMYLQFSSHLLMLSRCIEHLLSPLGASPHSFQTSC